MKDIFNSSKLTRDDLNTLHDCIGEATNNLSLTDEQLKSYWDKIPESIKHDAIHWGVDDTPTRDSIYMWAWENLNK